MAHPVLYSLMNDKWFGEIGTLRRSSWMSIQYWKWLFLNIWCLVDVVLFPVLFLVSYVIHICKDKARKKKGNWVNNSFLIFHSIIPVHMVDTRPVHPFTPWEMIPRSIRIPSWFLKHSREFLGSIKKAHVPKILVEISRVDNVTHPELLEII